MKPHVLAQTAANASFSSHLSTKVPYKHRLPLRYPAGLLATFTCPAAREMTISAHSGLPQVLCTVLIWYANYMPAVPRSFKTPCSTYHTGVFCLCMMLLLPADTWIHGAAWMPSVWTSRGLRHDLIAGHGNHRHGRWPEPRWTYTVLCHHGLWHQRAVGSGKQSTLIISLFRIPHLTICGIWRK